jgi:15-cis-phytoene desaturase
MKQYLLLITLIPSSTVCIVLAGKLAAEVVVDKAAGVVSTTETKAIHESVLAKQKNWVAKDPVGVKGNGAVAFGGGATFSKSIVEEMTEQDPANLVSQE